MPSARPPTPSRPRSTRSRLPPTRCTKEQTSRNRVRPAWSRSELRGRIDAVFLDEDGTVHLIDWKTGRPHKSYKQRLQLPLYMLAANRLWDVEPERMRLAYIFVPGGEKVEVEVGEGFLGSAERRVVNALDTIKSGAYDPSPSHHACSHCPVIGVGIEGCPTEVPEE